MIIPANPGWVVRHTPSGIDDHIIAWDIDESDAEDTKAITLVCATPIRDDHYVVVYLPGLADAEA